MVNNIISEEIVKLKDHNESCLVMDDITDDSLNIL